VEHILVYSRSHAFKVNLLPRTDEADGRYSNPDNDPRGPWISTDCTAQAGHGTKEQFYVYTTPKGRVIELQPGLCWRYTEKKMNEEAEAGKIWFGADGMGVPRKKTYLNEVDGTNIWTWWPHAEVGHTQEATKETAVILETTGVFDYPKPLRLLSRIVQIATSNDSIILDFFSGSATTAHAVMQLNAEDGGKRKFIMVQLPETCAEGTEAAKAGYKNICEIGRERIRRAGNKIKAEAGLAAQNLDIGFRVLKLDDTNMSDVYYSASEYTQDLLSLAESNIKDDRTDMDLLFGCLLEWGLPLSCRIHTR
jgi:adenine-specific DNA-methyltransferase